MLGPRRRGRRPQIVAPYIAFRWQIRRNTGVAFERREGDGGGCPPLGSHGRLRLPGCLAESCPNRAEREKDSAGSAGIIRGHPGRDVTRASSSECNPPTPAWRRRPSSGSRTASERRGR